MVGRDSSLVRLTSRAANSWRIAEQRARPVLALEAHDRRLVVAGRRGDAPADEHEAGLVLGVVLDVGGEHLEAVELGRERVADRGQVACASTASTSRAASEVECDARVSASGSFLREPAPALRDRVRERHDGADVGERRRPAGAHRLSDTGRSISRWISSSLSKASVSSVTDTEPSIMFSIGTTPPSTSPRSTAAITSGTDAYGVALARGEVGLGEQRLLGERPGRTEVRDASTAES